MTDLLVPVKSWSKTGRGFSKPVRAEVESPEHDDLKGIFVPGSIEVLLGNQVAGKYFKDGDLKGRTTTTLPPPPPSSGGGEEGDVGVEDVMPEVKLIQINLLRCTWLLSS